MKTIFTFLFLLAGLAVYAQPHIDANDRALVTSGSVAIPKTEQKGIAISKELQKEIKALEEQMKPYEDIYKEYNRMAGLKSGIYRTLIQAKDIDLKDLVAEPQITVDSIKVMVLKK